MHLKVQENLCGHFTIGEKQMSRNVNKIFKYNKMLKKWNNNGEKRLTLVW